MLLELTAGARIPRMAIEQNRDGSTRFRDRCLEEIAMQIAKALMNTPGAVEIREEMDPPTGDVVIRARCCVQDSRYNDLGRSQGPSIAEIMQRDIGYSMKKAQLDSMLDAMRYAEQMVYLTQKNDPLTFGGILNDGGSAAKEKNSTLTMDSLVKAMDAMKSELYDPVAFLQDRVGKKKAKDETREQFEVRQKAEAQIKKNTKKPGETPIRVEIGVRKIQMPGGE